MMFALTLTTLLAATAERPKSTIPAPEPLSPVTTLAVEQLPVDAASRGPINVDPLLSTIEFSGDRPSAKLLEKSSKLCPMVSLHGSRITLGCTTSRFLTHVDSSGKLMVISLRGIPWNREFDGVPIQYRDPQNVGRPPQCSDESPAATAECAYQAGDLAAAFREFSTLDRADNPDRDFAELRLGDIAEAMDDPERALGFYAELHGREGLLPPLADLRRCELVDDCPSKTLNLASYREPIRLEAVLHIARWEAFHGQWNEVVEMLGRELPQTAIHGACRQAEPLCRRLLLAGLLAAHRSHDDALAAHALTVYLDSPDRLGCPQAEALADAAAAVAEALGVPRFGAHMLAAAYPLVSKEHRSAHLLRTLELYLAAEDTAHADALAEFARAGLSPAEISSPEWHRALSAASAARSSTRARTPPKHHSPASAKSGGTRLSRAETPAKAEAMP